MSYVFAGCMSLIMMCMAGYFMGKNDENGRLYEKCLVELSQAKHSDAVDHCKNRVK